MKAPELRSDRAERGLVGSVLIDPPAYQRVAHVPPEALASWKLKELWRAAGKVIQEGRSLDYITVCDQLEKDGHLDDMGGSAYVAGLVTATVSSLHVEEYAGIVLDYAQRRKDVELAERLAKLAMNGGGSPSERAEIAHRILDGGPGTSGVADAYDAAGAALEELEAYLADPLEPGEIRDLSTGLMDLDRITGGLHIGLYAVGGVTSAGKTALALMIAVAVARAGKRVLFVSPEMSPADLMHRIVCAWARVDSRDWERGDLSPRQLEKVHEVLGWASEMPLLITQESDVGTIEAAVHRVLPLDLIVIDGVELLTGAESDRTHEQRGELSRWAKDIAEHPDVRCPVWLSMQVPTKQIRNRKDKRPVLGDIYGSSEPEFAADNVLFVHADDVWKPDPADHDNLIEVGYWKCRKKRREIPSSVHLLLDTYGAVRDVDVHAEEPIDFEESRWMD